MITPNKEPRDYRWNYAHNADYVLKTGIGHTAISDIHITYGNDYVEDLMGIRMVMENIRDFGGGETFAYFINTPWDEFSDSLGTWQDNTIQLEIDDVELTVDANCNWELSFSELRFYLDSVLKLTISAQTQSGTLFDHRLNISKMESVSTLTDIATPSPGVGCTNQVTCIDPWNTTSAYSIATTSNTSGGWQWKLPADVTWEVDEVRILPGSPPSVTCDCEAELPDIEFNVDFDSDQVSINSEFSFNWDKELGCEYDCTQLSPPCTDTWQDWYLTETWLNKNSSISCANVDAPIIPHQLTETAACGGTTDEDVTDTDELTAFSPYIKSGEKWECTITCTRLATPPPCTPGLDIPVCEDDCPYTFSCYAFGKVESGWPEFPPCDLPSTQFSCTHFPATSSYFAVYIKEDDVYILRQPFSIPVIGFSTEVQVTTTGNCARPAITLGTNGIIYVVYESDDDVKYKFSNDQGRTWNSEITLISNGLYPRIATAPNGRIAWAAFKYISGSSGPGKIYVISYGPGDTALPSPVIVKDETTADIEVADDSFDISYSNDRHGRWLLFARRDGETSPTHFATADKTLETFTEVYS